LPSEEEAAAASLAASKLVEAEPPLEDELPPEPEPAIVLDIVSDEALQVQVPEAFENSQPLYLESEPSVFADDAAADLVVDEPVMVDEPESDDQVKVIGPLRISIPLFNIYLNEADEQSRRLCTSLSEWALELHRPLSDDAIALAHSLAGNSATVGYIELSQLARLLDHSLRRAEALGRGAREPAELFHTAADELRHLLHQFAAGFLKVPKDELLQQLEAYDHEASRRLEALSLVGDQNLDDDGQEGRGTGHLRLVHTEEQENDPPETLDLHPAAEPSRGETPNEA